MNHTRIEIILVATNNKTCPVTALHTLFIRDPQPCTTFFFCLTCNSSTAFAKKFVINILQERVRVHNIITAKLYTGYNFRKGAV